MHTYMHTNINKLLVPNYGAKYRSIASTRQSSIFIKVPFYSRLIYSLKIIFKRKRRERKKEKKETLRSQPVV